MRWVNYYNHHIGDYLRDTVHLSLTEHGAYRRMLDLYYASEKPLPLDGLWLCRLVRAEKDDEREAVHFILENFFYKCAEGWRNKRADAEIKNAALRTKVARLNGKKGGRPITQRVSSGLANQKLNVRAPKPSAKLPITNNQEPIANSQRTTPLASSAKAPSAGGPLNGNAVAYIPLNDGKEFGVSQELAAELTKLYPAVDVPQTLNEIRGWNLANPSRKKTRRGVLSHINSWMSKEQNRGPQGR